MNPRSRAQLFYVLEGFAYVLLIRGPIVPHVPEHQHYQSDWNGDGEVNPQPRRNNVT